MARKRKKNKAGRPPKITPDILRKLEDAFSNSLPDKEACIYAGIAPSTLYAYQEKFPAFTERKELLKMTPNIAARETIVKALKSDVRTAQWWLEKKDPEYKQTTKVEHSGKIQTEDITTQDPAVQEAIKQYNQLRQKQIAEEAKAMP